MVPGMDDDERAAATAGWRSGRDESRREIEDWVHGRGAPIMAGLLIALVLMAILLAVGI